MRRLFARARGGFRRHWRPAGEVIGFAMTALSIPFTAAEVAGTAVPWAIAGFAALVAFGILFISDRSALKADIVDLKALAERNARDAERDIRASDAQIALAEVQKAKVELERQRLDAQAAATEYERRRVELEERERTERIAAERARQQAVRDRRNQLTTLMSRLTAEATTYREIHSQRPGPIVYDAEHGPPADYIAEHATYIAALTTWRSGVRTLLENEAPEFVADWDVDKGKDDHTVGELIAKLRGSVPPPP